MSRSTVASTGIRTASFDALSIYQRLWIGNSFWRLEEKMLLARNSVREGGVWRIPWKRRGRCALTEVSLPDQWPTLGSPSTHTWLPQAAGSATGVFAFWQLGVPSSTRKPGSRTGFRRVRVCSASRTKRRLLKPWPHLTQIMTLTVGLLEPSPKSTLKLPPSSEVCSTGQGFGERGRSTARPRSLKRSE